MHRLIDAQISAPESGPFIHTFSNVLHIDKEFLCDTASIQEYRQKAENYLPWSPTRFNSIVELVQDNPDKRLMVYDEDCGDASPHLLCILTFGDKLLHLLPVMAQIRQV